MNNKFCPLPWVFQAIRNNGDVRVCCQANTAKSRGLYRKENGEVYNAGTDDLQESRNSSLAKEIRKSMLEGEDHEACIRCDREDASGIRSRRQYENELLKDTFNYDHAVEQTSEDGTIDVDKTPVMLYDLRFGNLCNLKCRMCGPTDSSAWYDDWVKAWGREWFNDSHGKVELAKNSKGRYVAKFDDYNWFESDFFWNQVDKNIPNIQKIHTVGGEPLLIDQHYDLLQRCVDQDCAKNITVEYNTNLTSIPERAWSLWKHFKSVNLGVSIDGIGEVNDYIRNPSKFKQIEKNLHKLDNAAGNFNVWFAFTVQIYNAHHMPEFMKWVLQQDFKRIHRNHYKPIINPHPLHNPPFLNIKTLPPEAKAWIRTVYDEFYVWLDNYIKQNKVDTEWAATYRRHAHKVLEGYYSLMTSQDWHVDQLHEFYKNYARFDDIRNESFDDVFPELSYFINKELKKLGHG